MITDPATSRFGGGGPGGLLPLPGVPATTLHLAAGRRRATHPAAAGVC